MPPAVVPTGLACASTACGRPLGLAGRMWVHLNGDNGWTRACATGATATPPDIGVVHYNHGPGEESWHAMWEAVEYVIWHLRADDFFFAWSFRRLGTTMGVDEYHTDRPDDYETVVDQLPPIVAHWLRDAIAPF